MRLGELDPQMAHMADAELGNPDHAALSRKTRTFLRNDFDGFAHSHFDPRHQARTALRGIEQHSFKFGAPAARVQNHAHGAVHKDAPPITPVI